MSANGISTLATKADRQIAKLELAQTKRQLVGTAGYRELRYYDANLLPARYQENDTVITPHPGGLQQGRPWKTTPNILAGLWRSVYNNYWDTLETNDVAWFDSQTPESEGSVTDFTVADIMAEHISVQWLGYFQAPHTANYIFTIVSDDSSNFWIGDKAITGYTAMNADINLIGASDPIALTAGQLYPIRVQYGNNGSIGSFEFSWEDDATIEQTGLVVLLNAASGWDGNLSWLNDATLGQPSFNATTLNHPALNTTGGITSMSFNGIGTYWDVNNPTSGDFSVGVWFNTTSTAGTGTHFYDNPNIVGSDSSGPANDWGLCMRNGQIGFGGVSGQTAFTTPAFNDGAWHYVVATRVQTTGAMTIFVDGVQLGQRIEAPGAVLNASDKIRIASDPNNGTDWQGLISEVQFYQLALTPVQILSNFNVERITYGV